MLLKLTGFVAFVTVATLAAAQQPTIPAAAPSPAPIAAASEKKVCVQQVPTGSFMTKRVCHTKAEWTAIHAAEGQGVDQFRHGQTMGGAGQQGS